MRLFLLIFLFLAGCSSIKPEKKSDEKISKVLLGDWTWISTFNGCPEYGDVAFRSNGTYTMTTEDCLMADDGFGIFQYGWFVANNYICFVYDERQLLEIAPSSKELKAFLKSKKDEGFNKDYCGWEVVKYSSGSVVVRYAREREGGVEKFFTLKKSH